MKHNKIPNKIRTNILRSTFKAKSSHIGSCFYIVEILDILYFLLLKKNDTFILSKGHAALALYSVFLEKKLLSKSIFNSFGKNNTKLMAHVTHKINGVELSTGSLAMDFLMLWVKH